MKEKMQNIKKAVEKIEYAMDHSNKAMVGKLMEDMIHICEEIKNECMRMESVSNNIKMEKINMIPFMYKPILRKDYYEGTYLEEFSERRTSELKDANAYDVHNKFWKTYEVIQGNVFGSVPLELIGDEAGERLKRDGWKKVYVYVIEISKRECTDRELAKYCKEKYNKFILVNEKSTGAELILQYNV